MQLIGLLLFKHYRKEALEPYLKILCSRFGFCFLYFLLASQISLTRALDLAKSLVIWKKCTMLYKVYLAIWKTGVLINFILTCPLKSQVISWGSSPYAMRISLLRFFKTFQKYLAYAFFGLIISLLRFFLHFAYSIKIAVMK